MAATVLFMSEKLVIWFLNQNKETYRILPLPTYEEFKRTPKLILTALYLLSRIKLNSSLDQCDSTSLSEKEPIRIEQSATPLFQKLFPPVCELTLAKKK
jgi:hypothetical protein